MYAAGQTGPSADPALVLLLSWVALLDFGSRASSLVVILGMGMARGALRFNVAGAEQ